MAQLSVQTIRESGFISRHSRHIPYGDAVTWFQRFLVLAEVKHDAALWYEPAFAKAEDVITHASIEGAS